MKTIKAPHTFSGGVHPLYHKELSAAAEIRRLPLPPRLSIALSQHLGAPAKAIVKVGDEVKGGELLATAQGMISAPVHAPAAGKVVAIEEVLTAAGRTVEAVVLECAAEQSWEGLTPVPDWRFCARRDLAEQIGKAGIVGMGGAGFPTSVKLTPPADKPIDTVILNGAECEPYLTADYRMMVEHAAEICLGAEIIRHVLGARTIRVTIEDNKPEAIAAMERALQDLDGDAGVMVLPTIYPQGSEKQQVFSVTGREIPRGKLPMDVGCVVENVSTAFAIYEAIIKGRPLVRRVITITGSAVATPSNLLVPLGVTYADLLAACGGATQPVAKVISGGPMMGFTVGSLAITTGKTSSGLLLLTPAQVDSFTSMPCIYCGRCVAACPMRLSPTELSQCAEFDEIDDAEQLGAMDCIECGCCTFVCPAHRPLVQHIRRGKSLIFAKRMAKR